MNEHISIAKITKPSVSGIYERERLFRALDDGRKKPIIWVSSPAGSGKTTLVSSYLDDRKLPGLWYVMDEGDADPATFFYYLGMAASKIIPDETLPLLTPEYHQGISIFTKRFFERLFEKLPRPYTLVLDNYQDVPENSLLHDLIVHGLEMIPAGINVLIVSRTAPPSLFARLRANNTMKFVGWEDIRFTLEESQEIARIQGRDHLSAGSIEELYRKTQGWIAGLVLFMEGTRRGSIDQAALSSLVPGTVFDYFATEIFEKTEAPIREFLLKTAFLPAFTAPMATTLTGMEKSEQIISRLYKNHYFIEMRAQQDSLYHYHPLFREFLLTRANSFYPAAELSQIMQKAAELLEQSGQIEHAALLLREAQDWQGLAGLVLKNAEALFNQGRGKTLLAWLEGFPRDRVDAMPWLLYWTGIGNMAFDLIESRSYLERAFEKFKFQKDPAGLYLSWAGIINTFAYEYGDFSPLDRWISEMDVLLQENSNFPSQKTEAWVTYGMFTALIYRQPQHPDLPLWEQRLTEIVLSLKDIKLQTAISSPLLVYHSWISGDLEKVAFLVNNLKSVSKARDADPLSFIAWRTFEAAFYWMTASYEACLKAVYDGLNASEATGIHMWDPLLYGIGAVINTTSGNLDQAQKFIEKGSALANPSAYYLIAQSHMTSVFIARLRGDVRGEFEYAKAGLDLAKKSGGPWTFALLSFSLGTALLDNNERKKGLAFLSDARALGFTIKSHTVVYLSLIIEAEYFLKQNEEKAGLDALAKAMAIGRRQGFVNHSAWRDSDMSFLCSRALEAGIEVDYVQNLIKRRNLVPDASSVHIENWPWPLRIYALGRFRIEIDGKPVAFAGKVQKKPLAMLKSLISFGGREVSQMHVTDALWPDAEGDAAYRALITTLRRLRTLFGSKESVLFQDGRLCLDPCCCWMDVWAFERLYKAANDAWKAGKKHKGLVLYEQALNRYGGPLLGQEFDESGDSALRKSLGEKFIACIKTLGNDAEQHRKWKQAEQYYLRALAVDSRTEEFYRLLMACYDKAGRYGDAADVYDRCRKMLGSAFGVEPSTETEKLYRAITKKIRIDLNSRKP